ncbi:MAG: hypothetical protein RLZZ519_739 [Bacteroidota bacterium]|jgi:hypothetical protein
MKRLLHLWRLGRRNIFSGLACLLLIAGLLAPLDLLSQPKPLPISISLFNEATALPFTRFFTTPTHPGIQLGTEWNYKQGAHGRLFQTANVFYFYHRHLAQAVGVHSELAYEYRFKPGLALQGMLGIGYMHSFRTAPEFDFVNGEYVAKNDAGSARLYPSLSMDIGYYLQKENAYSPKIFLRYQSWVEFPYSPGFIPVMTHINLHLGAKFFLFSKADAHE